MTEIAIIALASALLILSLCLYRHMRRQAKTMKTCIETLSSLSELLEYISDRQGIDEECLARLLENNLKQDTAYRFSLGASRLHYQMCLNAAIQSEDYEGAQQLQKSIDYIDKILAKKK